MIPEPGRLKQPTLSQNFVPLSPSLMPHSLMLALAPDDVVPAGHLSQLVSGLAEKYPAGVGVHVVLFVSRTQYFSLHDVTDTCLHVRLLNVLLSTS